MSEAALKTHLQLCIQRAKTYTNAQVLELNEAVIAALEEIVTALEGKADSSDMTAALAGKADTTSVSSTLSFFSASGLYIDADGDIAQSN